MRLALLLGLALVGGALAQSGGHAGHGAAPQLKVPGNNLATLKGHAFDVEFTGQMLAHHEMAVSMAQHVLKAGKNARVRAAARQVIVAQMKEMELMRTWAKAWNLNFEAYGAVDMNMPLPGQVDRWFLTEMIPHHQGAVKMAKLVPARTQNAAVRKLAQEIISSQSAEINQYRAWLKVVK